MTYSTSAQSKKDRDEKDQSIQGTIQLTYFEQSLKKKGFSLVAGVDESGRGALAGPLVAAAVILPSDFHLPDLRECKQVAPQKREKFFDIIKREAVAEATSVVEPSKIDRLGLQLANVVALKEAATRLDPAPDYVLLDGFSVPDFDKPNLAITKGDTLSTSIAAASIISKVTRDRIMVSYHGKYPDYGFNHHKGYGTRKHLEMLKTQGPCIIHRKCFAPVRHALNLTLPSNTS